MFGDLGVNFPGRLIPRGFGHGFGLFGLATTFLCCRYHAGPPDRPTLTEPFPPASFGGWGQGHSRGRWGLLYRHRATARTITRPPAIRSCAYSRLIDGEVLGVAVTVYVLVPVAVAIEITGVVVVFVL